MEMLNERIKKMRLERHWSQKYVASLMGVYRTAIVEMESGKRKITADELKQFSELFQVSADALLQAESIDLPVQQFARQFGMLDDRDQREILNLMEFKKHNK